MNAGWRKNRTNRHGAGRGSALILTVVLTSLLAMVGVLFVMVTRIDKMGTQAATENRELTFAAETVVAEISELLAEDVPGVGQNEEYYDYPDTADPWLADLEPRSDANAAGQYRWGQITSLTGAESLKRDVWIKVIGDRDTIEILDVNDVNNVVTTADADGDGVGDAQWFEVPGIMSSRGRPIYAAVRIVDNGGMLNVNTGYWFDPNREDPSFSNPSYTDATTVDGSSVSQINAVALAGGHIADSTLNQSYAAALLDARRIDPTEGLAGYEGWVIWRYLVPDPCCPYTPFDLSDELELRYRGLLNHGRIDTRVENWGAFKTGTISTPVDSGGTDLDNWFARARDAGTLDSRYAYRHAATTYNMDRIIPPSPIEVSSTRTVEKMVNVNTANADDILAAIIAALSEAGGDVDLIRGAAAQITANLVDYIDDDDEVTAIEGYAASGSHYYGLERPCVYISEIAHNAVTDAMGVVHHSYAIELHKPYFEDSDPIDGQWRLRINDGAIVQPIVWSGLRRFHVLLAEDPVAELFDDADFSDPEEPADTLTRYGYSLSDYANPTAQALDPAGFDEGSTFALQRYVSATDHWLTVDFVRVASGDGWMDPDQGPRSTQRDVTPHKCIRRLWTETGVSPVVLGTGTDQYVDTDSPEAIQAHPANRTLRNIGELGMVLADSASGVIPEDAPASVLVNLADPAYAGLFNYLTVMDPAQHDQPATETRIMGRININTAPWFVLAQLPWIQYQDDSTVKSTRARAIVDYRETYGAFQSIAGLMQVTALRDLAYDGLDNLNDELPDRGPDLTDDAARDDLEERDLLFTRMSNLVTVRSDVFTAYVLVRLGANGPQKRMVAILDRSETTAENPAVEVIALHPVADPR